MATKKKSESIGKLVDAQAKGKKVRGARAESKQPGDRNLDVRTSKVEIDGVAIGGIH